MFVYVPTVLNRIGLKKIAVRMASNVEPFDNSESGLARYNAAWGIVSNQTVYPKCDICTWPVLPNETHPDCDEARKVLDRMCKQHGCHEEAVREGYCQDCWDYNYKCDGCKGDRRVCNDCVLDIVECTPVVLEDDVDDTQYIQDNRPDDECRECGSSHCDGWCEITEDPLAGDVDPTGGYPEPALHPSDAHLLSVMRQHGDYTG